MSKVKKHPGPKGRRCDKTQIVTMTTSLGRVVKVKRCLTFKPKK